MKSINDIMLEKRKEAIMLSKKAMQNDKIFQVSMKVKIKRSKLGISCGLIILFISILLYLVTSSDLLIGIFILGFLTLIVNLIMLMKYSI